MQSDPVWDRFDSKLCKSDSDWKQKEQSDVGGKPHLCRLERVGSVLLMYLIVKLNTFFGSLRWNDDHAEVRMYGLLWNDRKEPTLRAKFVLKLIIIYLL